MHKWFVQHSKANYGKDVWAPREESATALLLDGPSYSYSCIVSRFDLAVCLNWSL